MNQSELSIAAIRSLGIDIINKAKSGHPGMVLGSAPALYTLFTKHLRVNPEESDWFNRDRFVLASGHASALLYTLLHLSGFDLTMDDLKQFRQWGSRTPGHPEYGVTDGVDASSGPLGQGIPMGVGMAWAEKYLSTVFNKEDFNIVDHYTYVLCGDGDIQEGVTYEASSLAGHLSLGKLIVLYDSNDVTLDGPLSMSFSEDVKKRFEAMNWQVIEVKDGNDYEAINKAIRKAKKELYKPTLIKVNTIIGYGSKNQGTNAVHGAPLGEEDGKFAKVSYGYDYDDFTVPDEVYKEFKKKVYNRGKREYKKWNNLMDVYKEAYPDDHKDLIDAINGNYHLDYDELLKDYPIGKKEATRVTSQKLINLVAQQNRTFLSGTADLAASTRTTIHDSNRFSVDDYSGRNLYFGIREFAMVCIMNGMALHKGVKVSAGGFLVFVDYVKAGLRMSSLMGLPIIMPLSHDSIAVGEDGPTHQPVEQMAMLRSMLGVQVFRPADAHELAAAWKIAIETNDQPTCIALTRQDLPEITNATYENVCKGGYVMDYEENECEGIIIAAGSELQLAYYAKRILKKEGHDIRIVSIPSMDRFDQQDDEYKESVLPSSIRRRLAIEMSSDFGWHKYVGLDGKVLSVNQYGKSAPASKIIRKYGFTVDHVVDLYKSLL